MEIPGSGEHSHPSPRQTRNTNRPSPQYYMGMVRAITKVLQLATRSQEAVLNVFFI